MLLPYTQISRSCSFTEQEIVTYTQIPESSSTQNREHYPNYKYQRAVPYTEQGIDLHTNIGELFSA
jgi:hypothetical protein